MVFLGQVCGIKTWLKSCRRPTRFALSMSHLSNNSHLQKTHAQRTWVLTCTETYLIIKSASRYTHRMPPIFPSIRPVSFPFSTDLPLLFVKNHEHSRKRRDLNPSSYFLLPRLRKNEDRVSLSDKHGHGLCVGF